MIQKPDLLDLEYEEIVQETGKLGEKAFRAQQLWKWLYSGVMSFDEMKNLSKEFRSKLQDSYKIGGIQIAGLQESKTDGTKKYLFKLDDGNLIEGVFMKYHYGVSVCISTQVGCRMGCTFCASSTLGLVRNLTTGEMLAQILAMAAESKQRISHVVLMGIGEPFDNYDAVMSLLHRLNREDTLGISHRRMTVSSCGVVPGILRFADEQIPVNLSVSLHAPNDSIRSVTMPVSKKWSMDELLNACWIWVNKTGRRITFEYSLIEGVNDSVEHAKELSDRLKGKLCHVNLIPVNPIPDKDYRKTGKQQIERFLSVLERVGIAATVRRELGSDIEAACGQLRRTSLSAND
jgi:23S rRNA (adenine2503-C2)-methyltransferase